MQRTLKTGPITASPSNTVHHYQQKTVVVQIIQRPVIESSRLFESAFVSACERCITSDVVFGAYLGVRVGERFVQITDLIAAAIEDHARRVHPAECCGLLSGSNGFITDIHRLRNGADKPETRYFATPEQLFEAMRRIRKSSQSLLGVYHSHPRTPAYPSASDVEMAFYPEAFYFIISLEPSVDLRAFKIEDAKIEDVDIVRRPSP